FGTARELQRQMECGRQQPSKCRFLFKQTLLNQFSPSSGQISLEQFTAAPNVVPHGSDLTQAVIDRSHRGRQRNSKLPLKTDQPRNSSASRRSMKLRSMSVRWVFKSLRYRRIFASRVHREGVDMRDACIALSAVVPE